MKDPIGSTVFVYWDFPELLSNACYFCCGQLGGAFRGDIKIPHSRMTKTYLMFYSRTLCATDFGTDKVITT